MSTFLYYVSRRLKVYNRPRHIYAPPPAPASFVAWRPPPRPRIKRRRRWSVREFSNRHYPLPVVAPVSSIAWRPAPRAKIKRKKWFVRWFALRRYSIAGPPVSVLPHKKFPRPKIKRGKWNNRRFALRAYVVPGTAPVQHAAEWIIRARRRGRR